MNLFVFWDKDFIWFARDVIGQFENLLYFLVITLIITFNLCRIIEMIDSIKWVKSL